MSAVYILEFILAALPPRSIEKKLGKKNKNAINQYFMIFQCETSAQKPNLNIGRVEGDNSFSEDTGMIATYIMGMEQKENVFLEYEALDGHDLML
jgi:hypothetical protein